MKIIITYNNEAIDGFKSGWGFSCLIENNNKTLLFDTGYEGNDLLYNLKKSGCNLKKIENLLLSHFHWDHIGGLFDLLRLNKKATVFALKSFSKNFKKEIEKRAKLKEVEREQEIITNVYTTGLIKNNPDEQSLILKIEKGIVVIVGCAHPGLEKILKIAGKYGKIYAVIGGFHSFSDFNVLKDTKIIGACHCTRHKNEIKKRFPEKFQEIESGFVLKLK